MAGLTLADLGGPVHPQETQNADRSVSKWYGINLRDYFAAAALTGILSTFTKKEASVSLVAVASYRFADAMLGARKPKEGSNG